MKNESLEYLSKMVVEYGKGIKREPITQDYSNFPSVGDRLKFKGVPSVYYPMFTNVGTFARNNLVVGQEYSVSRVEVNSSWCAIWLEGFGENFFHLSFFEKTKLPVIKSPLVMVDGRTKNRPY